MSLSTELASCHTEKQIKDLALKMAADPSLQPELLELFFHKDSKINKKAFAIIHYVMKEKAIVPSLVTDIITRLHTEILPDAIVRNCMKLLQFVTIPEVSMGILAERCFNLLSSPKTAVAIKVFSMTVLYHLTLEKPDMRRELLFIIEDQMPYASPGFLSRGNKIINKLKKQGCP